MRASLPLFSHLHSLSNRLSPTASPQSAPNFDQIRRDLLSRPLNILEDYLTPTNSKLLSHSLSDFLPPSYQALPATGVSRFTQLSYSFPQGHHLVYFPNRATSSQLLPDGTDTFHSPGAPFVRRMWAGGSVHFNANEEYIPFSRPHMANRAVCLEGIRDVRIKGAPDQEKIFVDIERQYALRSEYGDRLSTKKERTLFFERTADHFSPFYIFEKRTLVFMRAAADVKHGDQSASSRFVKPPLEAEFSMEIVPTPSLLFRFSALSFNAHLIHLSSQYASDIEGHRDMLVHGPLTLVLILSLLQSQLREHEMISSFHYRNLAPLYVNEMMKVCGRRKSDGSFVMWIEDNRGSLAVKGDATVAIMITSVPNKEKKKENESKGRKEIVSRKEISTTVKRYLGRLEVICNPSEKEMQNRNGKRGIDMGQKKYLDPATPTAKDKPVVFTISAKKRKNQPEVGVRRKLRIVKHLSGSQLETSKKPIVRNALARYKVNKNTMVGKGHGPFRKRRRSFRKIYSEPSQQSFRKRRRSFRELTRSFRKTYFEPGHQEETFEKAFRDYYQKREMHPDIAERMRKAKALAEPDSNAESLTVSDWRVAFLTSPEWKSESQRGWRDKYRSMMKKARIRRNPLRARAVMARKSEKSVEKTREEDLKLVDQLFGMIERPKKP